MLYQSTVSSEAEASDKETNGHARGWLTAKVSQRGQRGMAAYGSRDRASHVQTLPRINCHIEAVASADDVGILLMLRRFRDEQPSSCVRGEATLLRERWHRERASPNSQVVAHDSPVFEFHGVDVHTRLTRNDAAEVADRAAVSALVDR